MLVSVASSVDQNPWWADRLHTYMKTLPAMLVNGHRVGEYERFLEQTHDDCPDLEGLLEMVKQMSVLMSTMRRGTTEKLQVMYMSTLSRLWKRAKENFTQHVDRAAAQSWSALLAETSTCWPLDTGVATMMVDCSSYVQKAGQGQLLTELSNACLTMWPEGLSEDKIGERELLKAVDVLRESLCGISLPRQILESSPATLENLQNAAKSICKHAQAFLTIDCGALALLNSCKIVLQDLSDKLGRTHWKPNAVLFAKAVELRTTWEEHNAVLAEPLNAENYKVQLQAISNLKRQLLQVNQVDMQMATMEPALQETVQTMVAAVQLKHDARKSELLVWAESTLVMASRAGEEVAMGAPEGRSWLQDFRGKSFENLMDHWSNTMALLDGTNLVKLKEQLHEALTMTVSVLSLWKSMSCTRIKLKVRQL
eukprot:6492769-Amphidinium_carterae.2